MVLFYQFWPQCGCLSHVNYCGLRASADLALYGIICWISCTWKKTPDIIIWLQRECQDHVYVAWEYWSTMWKIWYYLKHGNKVNGNKGLSNCEALRYMRNNNNNKKLFSFMSSLQTYYHFKRDFQRADQHIGSMWLIHGTKRHRDNQFQSLELPCMIS